MDLQHCDHCGFNIIGFRIRSVVDVYWKATTRNFYNRGSIEVLRELLGLKSGRRNYDLEIRTLQAHILDKGEDNIRMQRSLMGLVHNHGRIRSEVRFVEELPEQHSVSHVLYNGILGGVVLEPNRVAYFLPQFDTHLFSHARCHAHGGYSSRLGTPHFPCFRVANLVQILRKLSGLPGSRLPYHYNYLVVPYQLEKLLPVLENWQGLLH